MLGRQDPYRNFRFRIEIDGITQAGFHECHFGDTTSEVIEYREGGDPPAVRKESGPVHFGNIVLKRGITDSMELYTWRKQVEDTGAQGARKNMSIILIDEAGNDRARWDFKNAWPARYGLWNDFDAKGHGVLYEVIEVAHEGFRRVR